MEESVAVTLSVPGLGSPRAGNSPYTLSTAAGRWGDLEAVIYPLHPLVESKRVGTDHFYAFPCISMLCPLQHSVTKSLVPGTSVGKPAVGKTKHTPVRNSSGRPGAAPPHKTGVGGMSATASVMQLILETFIANMVCAKQFSTFTVYTDK